MEERFDQLLVMKRVFLLFVFLLANFSSAWAHGSKYEDQPLYNINILNTEVALHKSASISVELMDNLLARKKVYNYPIYIH